jgi:hypothetical protein
MSFDLKEAVEILERTPAVLRAQLEGLSENWIRADEGPDTWCPRRVVEHLIHGDSIDWVPRARIILTGTDDQAFEPYDPEAVVKSTVDKSLGDLLDDFVALRAENMKTLLGMDLGPGDLDRTGKHPAFGTVTLEQLLATWVAHDLGHLAQIDRVMARRWRDEAGPWREYLRILD